MNKIVSKLPSEPSFIQKGLTGYNYDIDNKDISFSFEEVITGHDKYVSNNISIYYYVVLDGKGIFKINGENYEVEKNDIIEVKPNSKFVFAGTMKLLLISTPKYNFEDDNSYEDNDLI